MLLNSGDLNAAQGGLILLLILLIVSTAVFAVKFALDIALSKKFTEKYYSGEQGQVREQEKPKMYAVDSSVINRASPRKAPKKTKTKAAQYTLIPDDKIFIVKHSD